MHGKLQISYEVFIGVLALVAVLALGAEMVLELTPAQEAALGRLDVAIIVVFGCDYAVRLWRAENRKRFFMSNVLDLVAIIPFSKVFRLARFARIARTARLTRTTRLFKLGRLMAFGKRFGFTVGGILRTNGLIYAMSFTVGMVLLGACGIYMLERGQTMASFGDAVWWSLVTTTTVGYGDISPVTTGGRVLAGILMVIGIGFVGMVTGSIATYFLSPAPKPQAESDGLKRYVLEALSSIESLSEPEFEHLLRALRMLRSSQPSPGESDDQRGLEL